MTTGSPIETWPVAMASRWARRGSSGHAQPLEASLDPVERLGEECVAGPDQAQYLNRGIRARTELVALAPVKR